MSVRHAAPADLAEVQALLVAMHGETIYRQVALDEGKLGQFLRFACDDPAHALLVYQRADAPIDGVYIGNLGNYFFSDELGAWDLTFYVSPDRRGSLCAARLWKAFRDWAVEKGAKTVWPGSSTGIMRERTSRFYRGMGLDEVGSVFFQRL